MILGIISFIVNVIGVILYYANISPSMLMFFTVVGGSLGLFENAIGIFSGQQNSLITLIIAIVISFFVFNGQLPWWLIILIGAMFESAITGIFSIPLYIAMFNRSKNIY